MALMRPRRWLGYTIVLNDLLPEAERMIDRFETSEVPLDNTFGSSSHSAKRPRSVILAIGPNVEQPQLIELFDLLSPFSIHYVHADQDPYNRKLIYVGSYNLDNDPVARLDADLECLLRSPGLSPQQVADTITKASTLQALTIKSE